MRTAIAQNISVKRTVKTQRLISLDAFRRLCDDRKDDFKYEWNNGVIEKTENMKQTELYIVNNLMNLFCKLKFVLHKVNGILTTEVDTWTSTTKFRRPDLAYFTEFQIQDSAENGNNHIPRFVIEVISTNDQVNEINNKVFEYFAAGVQVVWHIFPQQKMVHIYNSPSQISVCLKQTICSAESVIPGFALTAEEIFHIHQI